MWGRRTSCRAWTRRSRGRARFMSYVEADLPPSLKLWRTHRSLGGGGQVRLAGRSKDRPQRGALCGGGADPADGVADLERRREDLADWHEPLVLVAADGFQARAGDAPAIRAVGVPSELARGDAVLEVRRQALGGLGEYA